MSKDKATDMNTTYARTNKVLLIYTGGTIGMGRNVKTGALEPLNFQHMISNMPELVYLETDIDTYQFANPIDSSDITPHVWAQLVRTIGERYEQYDGFVIVHGTDTMAYTASALSYMLENLTKPVILTGSQLPIGQLRTDGKENLLTSIELASAHYDDGRAIVPEVCIYFGGQLLRGNRSTKQSADGFNAFATYNYPVLCHAGVNFTFHYHHILQPDYDRPMVPHTGMDSIDGRNSSKYISTNLRHGAELGYRLHTETINMMGGLNLQASRLDGEQDYYAWDETTMGQNPNFNTSRNYFSVLPNMRFEWSPVQGTSVNVDYRARTSNPSISNLQELVNTSNPMSYTTGNKDLDQSTSHNVNVRFIHSNMEKATNIMLFANYSFQMDYIGTQYVTNYSDASLPMTEISWINALSAEQQKQYQNLSLAKGATFSRPVNMDGYRNASVGLSYGFPWDLVMSNVNLGLNANYSITPSQQLYYTYDSISSQFHATDFTSKVKNFSISPRLFISSNISQDLDFSLSYSPTYQKVTDEVNDNNNYEYFNQSANARLNWTFWKNFTLEQDLSYTYYGGASMPSVIDEWIWNMSVGKKFGKKNSTEVKLQIYDLLNQRTGYSRNVSSTGITQSYTNYMPRYFMLTVSYKIANYKSSSELKERRRGGGGFGGPRF